MSNLSAQHRRVLEELLQVRRSMARTYGKGSKGYDNAMAEVEALDAALRSPWKVIERDGNPTQSGLYLTVCFGGGKWIFDTVRYDHLKWHAAHSNIIEAWMEIPTYQQEAKDGA